MKIFISHSSKNADYGNAVVKLLTDVGVRATDIVFTSNSAYGVPLRKNIFEWLKGRIQEQSFVIYLLSEEYYASVACLNEMGAAWVIGNKGVMLFVPGFDLNCPEFRSGPLDPQEIGVFLFEEERVTEFVESLKEDFPILDKQALLAQAIRKFLAKVNTLSESTAQKSERTVEPVVASTPTVEPSAPVSTPTVAPWAPVPTPSVEPSAPLKIHIHPSVTTLHPVVPSKMDKYLSDLKGGKLKDSDVMLIWYAAEQGRSQLMTGWQENDEVENIREWEDVNGYPSVLSAQYSTALRRLKMRKFVTVSQETSSGKAKEMEIISPLVELLTTQHDEIESYALAVIQRVQSEEGKKIDFSF